MSEMWEQVRELTPDEFMRLATVIYEAGQSGQFGDPISPDFKAKLRTRIEIWLEM